jgi:hypothetical protein
MRFTAEYAEGAEGMREGEFCPIGRVQIPVNWTLILSLNKIMNADFCTLV